MPTPSSGTICWSQIQAEIGTGYCMSNFYTGSGGRGYCASDYYSYPPPPPSCTLYYADNYGYVLFYDCAGNSQYFFVGPGDQFCVSFFDGGPAYNTGIGCL
jgi:hypothetical protein